MKLMDCPFCGSVVRIASDMDGCRFVICDECGARMRVDFNPEKWNKREYLTALEAEKPAEDARSLAIDISLGALDRAEFWEVIVPKRIRSFSESYHAKKCAECKEMKKLYVKFGNESPPDACLSCGRRCPNDCPLDETPEALK